jgi:hypothetical protein
MDWGNFRFDKVHWCVLAGHPTNKFESEARAFAMEKPGVMQLFAEECTRIIESDTNFSFKDVVARVRFTHGVKLSNNLAAPLQLLMYKLFNDQRVECLYRFQFGRRIRASWTDRTRVLRTATGITLNAFSNRYGTLLSNKDRDARAKLYYDQDLHLMFVQACKDAIQWYEDSGADWKVSVKDILQAARLNYRIKVPRRLGDERVYNPLFSNTDVTYYARMMLVDVPELKRLVNGVKRIKHELDKEAMLVVPEAFLEV